MPPNEEIRQHQRSSQEHRKSLIPFQRLTNEHQPSSKTSLNIKRYSMITMLYDKFLYDLKKQTKKKDRTKTIPKSLKDPYAWCLLFTGLPANYPKNFFSTEFLYKQAKASNHLRTKPEYTPKTTINLLTSIYRTNKDAIKFLHQQNQITPQIIKQVIQNRFLIIQKPETEVKI